MKTAEDILNKNMRSYDAYIPDYSEEKTMVLAAMEEYASQYKNQSLPIEQEQEIMAAKEHFEVERTLWSMEVLEKEQEIERLREALQRIDPTNPALESSPTEQPEAQKERDMTDKEELEKWKYHSGTQANTIIELQDQVLNLKRLVQIERSQNKLLNPEQQNQPQPESEIRRILDANPFPQEWLDNEYKVDEPQPEKWTGRVKINDYTEGNVRIDEPQPEKAQEEQSELLKELLDDYWDYRRFVKNQTFDEYVESTVKKYTITRKQP